MECSCPDWSRPCKHIAAVFYLLGEEFDRDPFLLFRRRGMEREELTAAMSGIAAGAAVEDEPVAPEPIDATDFWSRPLPPGRLDEAAEPAVAAALLHRLGRLPFWTGDEELIAALEPVYRRAALRYR